jgi:hypothetical protein
MRSPFVSRCAAVAALPTFPVSSAQKVEGSRCCPLRLGSTLTICAHGVNCLHLATYFTRVRRYVERISRLTRLTSRGVENWCNDCSASIESIGVNGAQSRITAARGATLHRPLVEYPPAWPDSNPNPNLHLPPWEPAWITLWHNIISRWPSV